MHNSYMFDMYKKRRIVIVILSLITFASIVIINTPSTNLLNTTTKTDKFKNISSPAIGALSKLAIKGRAPKTNYSRQQFGANWKVVMGCDTRNSILNRDLADVVVDEKCNVISGILNDPYTGKVIKFTRGSDTSSKIQIDHVVALSDAWQKGAQQFTVARRIELANDPLELLAVDGASNLQKSDGDAATWLPSNKSFRCQYVSRQIAVKQKYSLWLTQAEYDTIETILSNCPNQPLPNP